MKALAILLGLATAALAGEYAVLGNGFRLYADRHEADGASIRLYSKGGMTEFPAFQIAGFEMEEQIAPPPAPPAASLLTPQELVTVAAKKHGLPPAFVDSVVDAESGYRVDAVSSKGAIGLMQLMPATAQAYGADPSVPQQNVEAGTQYLRELLLRYKDDENQVSRAVAAYNAGPGAVDRYRGVPPYRETQTHVLRVIQKYEQAQK